MFGSGSQAGRATIVVRETHDGVYRKGINFYNSADLHHTVYDYIADVAPDEGGVPFRASFTELFVSADEYHPVVGDDAIVTISKDNDVAFDRKALQEKAQAAKAEHKDSLRAIADASPGDPVPRIAPAARPSPSSPAELDQVHAMSELLAAKRRGDTAEVARLKAVIRQPGSMPTPPPAD
jgi:hypothetical protein